jgi:hypothetical protein
VHKKKIQYLYMMNYLSRAFLLMFTLGLTTDAFAQQSSLSNSASQTGDALSTESRVASSAKPLNNDPAMIRFAIMSDRTGGMLPGIFEIGVKKINLLQPEFVISVGDLIDGYTTDPKVWNAQWEEFDAIIDGLDMRFFYVAGNHDISNELLLNEWMRRKGDPYYHFVYNNVLFLVLHTEDGPGVTAGISNEQIDFIERVLQENSEVRWTFLFKHRPLWQYGNALGFERIESSLHGRNYTVFSGHHHHYFHTSRNGMKHYTLATTGGGSYLRGWEFGEFEHITLVTLPTEGEPIVAHLELSGIHDESIVTEKNYSLVQALRLGQWVDVHPTFHPNQFPNQVTVDVTMTNSEALPLSISGLFKSDFVDFYPSSTQFEVPAHTDTIITLTLTGTDFLDLHDLNESNLSLTFEASYDTDLGTLSLPVTKRLTFDYKHQVNVAELPIVPDALLDEWDQNRFTEVRSPVYLHEDWDWRGADDGWFRFSVTRSDEHLWIALEATDNRLIGIGNTDLEIHQDQFFIHLDATGKGLRDDVPDRLYGSDWIDGSYFLQARVAPSPDAEQALIATNLPEIALVAAARFDTTRGQMVAEIGIPLSYIDQVHPDSNEFRLNIGWMDHDRPENTKPSILWWRPVWGKSGDFKGAATFGRPE